MTTAYRFSSTVWVERVGSLGHAVLGPVAVTPDCGGVSYETEETMSHRTLLKAACMALWGPNYRSELARQLDVHLRTAMRWDRGESAIPQTAWDALSKLLAERQREIDKVLPKIPTGEA